MTNTQHTPGPWAANLYKGAASVIKINADEGMNKHGGHGIALMNSGHPIADDANARLIAAAPELLYALEECLNQLDTNDMCARRVYQHLTNERRNMLSAAKLIARKAIAKAKGESNDINQ